MDCGSETSGHREIHVSRVHAEFLWLLAAQNDDGRESSTCDYATCADRPKFSKS